MFIKFYKNFIHFKSFFCEKIYIMEEELSYSVSGTQHMI